MLFNLQVFHDPKSLSRNKTSFGRCRGNPAVKYPQRRHRSRLQIKIRVKRYYLFNYKIITGHMNENKHVIVAIMHNVGK